MTSILAVVGIICVQAATGAALWLTVRRSGEVSGLQLLGVGLALGTFMSMLCGVLTAQTPLASVGWLFPSVVAAIAVVATVVRRGGLGCRITLPLPQAVAFVVSTAAGLAVLIPNWVRVPLGGPAPDSFTDLYFFEALSRGLAQFGVSENIFMIDGTLRYHWFSYAWAGELAQLAGTNTFASLTRVLPLVTTVAATALAVSWAGSLSKVRWVPSLAGLLVVVAGYSGALYGAVLNFDSPSQAMTTVWLMALAVAVVAYLDRHVHTGALILIALLAVACSGGKASHAVVIAGGFAAVLTVGFLWRTAWRRRAMVAALVFAVSAVATYLYVLSGVAIDRNLAADLAVKASTWQGLDPAGGFPGVALGTVALILAILARVAGLGWFVRKPVRLLDPSAAFAVGGLVVGLLAMLYLRDGVNDLWFVLAASGPAAVVAAVGGGKALSALRQQERWVRHPLVTAIIVSIPASVICLLLTMNWSTYQHVLNWAAPLSVWIAVPVSAIVVTRIQSGTWRTGSVVAVSLTALMLTGILTRPSSVWTASRPIQLSAEAPMTYGLPPGDPRLDFLVDSTDSSKWPATVEAATWVQSNTPATAVFAVSKPGSAVVPALTGRLMYIAGLRYQLGLGRAGDSDAATTQAVASREFAELPSPATARPLCDAGVDYAWLEEPSSTSLQGTVFSNSAVTIVRLADGYCT